MELVMSIIAAISALVAVFTSITTLYMWKRARVAEVKSKEITTADDMVELINKVMERALAQMSKENEKLRKIVARFEKAVRLISTCPNRDNCPITDQLQDNSVDDLQ